MISFTHAGDENAFGCLWFVAAVGLAGGGGSAAAAPGPCVAPPASDAAATYEFIHTYRSECATNLNYDRTFPDVTLATTVDGTNQMSVTTPTALAGAIASVRVNGKEFIASGGYGAALQTTVDLQPDGVQELADVIRLNATLTSDDDTHDHFDGVLVAYLQRDFTDAFSVDPATRVLTPRPKDSYTSKDPLVRCTTDGAYCMGILTVPSAVAAGTYYYSMSRPPNAYNGMTGEDTIQITAPRGRVARGDKVSYEVYLAVGNRQRVADTLAVLQGVVAGK